MNTSKEQISKIYYSRFIKQTFLSNLIFVIMIATINVLVDRELLPMTTLQFFKSAMVYLGMAILMTLVHYYLNRLRTITLYPKHLPFIKKQLDFLNYKQKEKTPLLERYEPTTYRYLAFGGDIFIQKIDNQIHISGPIKTMNILKDRLSDKFKKEFQLS